MKRLAVLLSLVGILREAQAQTEHPFDTLRRVATATGVPAGMLYGIWKKESDLLVRGWRTDREDWYRAANLVRPGGKCLAEYDRRRCARHWASLVALCSQRRRDGSRLCDPGRVYTSYALAMGPMQHMPAEIVRQVQLPDGRLVWQWKDAVDWNRDGLVDPHDLGDALAMTALELRRYLTEGGSWQWAANRYYGSQTEGYFEGGWESHGGNRRFRFGVRHWWIAWCRAYNCREPTSNL